MARKRGAVAYRIHKVCPGSNCSKKFSTNRKNKIYCSPKCQYRAWAERNQRVPAEALAALKDKV